MVQGKTEEVDFIRRKYIRHIFQLILTFLFVCTLLTLDIFCFLIEKIDYHFIYLLLELLFCIGILILAFLEIRYYYRVKNNRFGLLYSSIIDVRNLRIFIIVLIILYFTDVIIEFITVGLEWFPDKTCRYLNQKSQMNKIFITLIFTICQTIMMIIPYKIRKTLSILKQQQNRLLDLVPNSLTNTQNIDIVAENGEFKLFTSNLDQIDKKIYRVSKSKLKKTLCMICTSRIWKSTKIIRLPCNHMFHKQCFVKYYNYTTNQRQSLIIKCEVCQQTANANNLFSLLIDEHQ